MTELPFLTAATAECFDRAMRMRVPPQRIPNRGPNHLHIIMGDPNEIARTATRYAMQCGIGPGQVAPARRRTKVRRNDPCPCGSGRKFKVCCAGKFRAAGVMA